VTGAATGVVTGDDTGLEIGIVTTDPYDFVIHTQKKPVNNSKLKSKLQKKQK
jgi:hypothetical protein